MLVLTRRKDEEILIDGDIKIVVLKVTDSKVRLGISAPAHVKVLRGELKPFGLGSGEAIIEYPIPTSNAG